MATTEKQLEQAKEIVQLLQKKCNTNGYVGVEIDHPFDNLDRYTGEYTITNCLFENILDEITVLSENVKYGEEMEGLSELEAKRHIKKLKKFVKDHAKNYFTGTMLYNYLSEVE